MCMHNYKLTPLFQWWIQEYVSYVLINMVYCYSVAVSVITFPCTLISLVLSCLETLLAVIFQVSFAMLSLCPDVLQRDSSGRFRALIDDYGGWSGTCIFLFHVLNSHFLSLCLLFDGWIRSLIREMFESFTCNVFVLSWNN